MKKDERGAIVVEATLSLSVFMFAIVTLLTIINICIAQAKIGTAIQSTAKEISQYSYLYGLTGLADIQGDMHGQGEQAQQSAENIVGGISTIFSSISDAGDLSQGGIPDPESLKDLWDGVQQGGGQIGSEVENIIADPKGYILSAAYMFGNELTEEVKSKAMAPLVKSLTAKHLKGSSTDESNAYLEHLGVVGGLDGLDFEDSVFFLNGTDEIKIVVDYKVKVIELLGIDLEYSFRQSAMTRAW